MLHSFSELPIKWYLDGKLLTHKNIQLLHWYEKNQERWDDKAHCSYPCVHCLKNRSLLQLWGLLHTFFHGLGSNLWIERVCEFEVSAILQNKVASGHVKHRQTRQAEKEESRLLFSTSFCFMGQLGMLQPFALGICNNSGSDQWAYALPYHMTWYDNNGRGCQTAIKGPCHQ